jgi:hypothetical protein
MLGKIGPILAVRDFEHKNGFETFYRVFWQQFQ